MTEQEKTAKRMALLSVNEKLYKGGKITEDQYIYAKRKLLAEEK